MTSQLAIYARVSSRKQEQEKTIDSQLSALRDFVLKNGLDLIEENIFADNGVSGSSLERPALDRLRDKAFSGEIAQLIVHSPDRLARKYSHQIILTEEFKNMGVTVEFLNRKISQSPEDHLLFQVQGIISEYEERRLLNAAEEGSYSKPKTGIYRYYQRHLMGMSISIKMGKGERVIRFTVNRHRWLSKFTISSLKNKKPWERSPNY